MTSATPKPRAGEHVRWADQYDFDRSDPATRLFIAASNWVDRCEAAEAERDALRAQNSDLAKALETCDKAIRGVIGDGPVRGNGTPYPIWADMISAAVEARALLAKHRR